MKPTHTMMEPLNQRAFALEVKDLSYAYPDGHQALHGVSLALCPGEKVALVGPNGAGKSTLLVHLNGIIDRQSGRIEVCGLELSKKTVARVRALVGLVFQSPDDQLFSPTVFDDVAFGPIYQGLPASEVQATGSGSAVHGAHGKLHQARIASPQYGREETHRHRHRALDEARTCWCWMSLPPVSIRAPGARSSSCCASCPKP